MKKVLERWGCVEIVNAALKGLQSFEWHSIYNLSLTVLVQLLTNLPSSIVYLLVKLRLSPPGATVEKKESSVEETKRLPRTMNYL